MKRGRSSEFLDEDAHEEAAAGVRVSKERNPAAASSCASSSRSCEHGSKPLTAQDSPKRYKKGKDITPSVPASRPRARSDPPHPAGFQEVDGQKEVISSLCEKATALNARQRELLSDVERLQQRCAQSEQNIAELLRQQFKVQLAISQRREQHKVDKEQLESQKHQLKLAMEEIDGVLRQLQSLNS